MYILKSISLYAFFLLVCLSPLPPPPFIISIFRNTFAETCCKHTYAFPPLLYSPPRSLLLPCLQQKKHKQPNTTTLFYPLSHLTPHPTPHTITNSSPLPCLGSLSPPPHTHSLSLSQTRYIPTFIILLLVPFVHLSLTSCARHLLRTFIYFILYIFLPTVVFLSILPPPPPLFSPPPPIPTTPPPPPSVMLSIPTHSPRFHSPPFSSHSFKKSASQMCLPTTHPPTHTHTFPATPPPTTSFHPPHFSRTNLSRTFTKNITGYAKDIY